ncbi:uncharacterized protein N7459_001046 [Penicillium hispanicum]|uniref:uncharacterized protein n=1 Tax=Penicillium hispanicum TaxID=1080232 RepID=UPI0025400BBF|nr:uncharacterized protein N7459_001046 [Penicillium hispanicum]KAJ5594838.1 hypothetical protein N7459_001046 [Penicillium hispanicum]
MSTHTIQVPLPCAPEIWSASTESIWRRVKGSYPKPLNFNEMVKLLIEDGEAIHANHPLDGLSLTLILHGLMSMCNDMVHFDNRSIYLSDVEKDEISWKPWRKRMIHALETWKACYDIYIMTTLQGVQDQEDPRMYANHQAESVTLLALYHVAHIVINCEIRHLQAAAGMKAIFGHIVTSADRVESIQWVKQWVTTHAAAADHAAWHAAQMFREGLLYLKKWDAKGEFHYPWCFVIGTLTCWAFHRFGGEDMQPSLCAHRRGAEMTQEQSQALMNQLVSLMASVSTVDVRRTLQKCCTHGLSREVARYLKNVRWTAAFEAMKLLEGLSDADSL